MIASVHRRSSSSRICDPDTVEPIANRFVQTQRTVEIDISLEGGLDRPQRDPTGGCVNDGR